MSILSLAFVVIQLGHWSYWAAQSSCGNFPLIAMIDMVWMKVVCFGRNPIHGDSNRLSYFAYDCIDFFDLLDLIGRELSSAFTENVVEVEPPIVFIHQHYHQEN